MTASKPGNRNQPTRIIAPRTIPPHTIAVLGANGRLSREVARTFHRAGWHVIAITRSGQSAAFANLEGIELRAADALDRQALIAATAGADVIFNGLNPPYTDWAEKALPMAENALAAAEKHHALHLFPGNVYNFGSALPESLTPQTPFRPDHRKAQIRCQMETLFEQAAGSGRVKTVILRAGDFFGSDGTGSWFDLVIAKRAGKGIFTWPGKADILHAWAYLPDLAEAFVHLVKKADTLPGFSHFHFAGHNVSGLEMHAAAEKAMGQKLKHASLPGFVLKIAGLFSPMMRETSQVFYLWQKPHRMDGTALEDVIGPLPRTPLDHAVRDALKALGHVGNRAAEPSALAVETA